MIKGCIVKYKIIWEPISRLYSLTRLGILISVLWILLSFILIMYDYKTLQGLNEWGDFLAGMAGPLALLWLVLGYFQQQKELNQNTNALIMQRDELERTADEQRRLAQNAVDQTSLLVSPFVAMKLGEIKHRNSLQYREVWAQNIGAQAAYFSHNSNNLHLLENNLGSGFWCPGDEHYFEVSVMPSDIEYLSLHLYNRLGDLVICQFQFVKGDKGVPKSVRLVRSSTILGSEVTKNTSVPTLQEIPENYSTNS